jgi:hypothetical protein
MSRGSVYILTNPAMPGLIKIGKTTRSVEARISELWSTGVPLPFECYDNQYVPDCSALEATMHVLFAEDRVSGSREFFKTKPGLASKVLRDQMRQQVTDLVAEFDECLAVIDETHALDILVLEQTAAGLGISTYLVVDVLRYLELAEIAPALDRWRDAFAMRKARREAGLGPGSLDPDEISREIKERDSLGVPIQ